MARTVGMRNPQTSNPAPSGITQGSPGGRPRASSARPGSKTLQLGDEMYLWILVILEAFAMGYLRKCCSRHHGG